MPTQFDNRQDLAAEVVQRSITNIASVRFARTITVTRCSKREGC